MSQRYKGAVISATPPTVSATSPNAYGTAKGVWTLEQQLQYKAAGTWPSPFAPVYIEDTFSTYLYTGNGSSQTITNNINLSGNGGLVWVKSRFDVTTNSLVDTVRGAGKPIYSNSTTTQQDYPGFSVSAFGTTGFTVTDNAFGDYSVNNNNSTYVSWTFREQPKFFDIVTWTGNGTGDRTISHNLGSTPGCIITKATSASGTNWHVFHRGVDTRYGVGYLNAQNAWTTGTSYDWNPTSTTFLASAALSNNDNGTTYVAYLFAHDAGGFGDSGLDSVIKCGSFTTTAGGLVPDVNLGWEPQWVLIKRTDASGPWFIIDSMRGYSRINTVYLYANTSDSEGNWEGAPYLGFPTATGFSGTINSGVSNASFIYVAIRRGPMKTPTSGTEVFDADTSSGTQGTKITTGFALDTILEVKRSGGYGNVLIDRLRGLNTGETGGYLQSGYLVTNGTGAEASYNDYTLQVDNTGFEIPNTYDSISTVYYSFKRAPGFMDVVCYSGNGSTQNVTHNLGVVPEFMFVKQRGAAGTGWMTYHKDVGNTKYLNLNTTAAEAVLSGAWNNTTPTASVFTLGSNSTGNANAGTYVWHGFASITGISKVGSYTGTGTTLQIDCGFTSGARFVVIKRYDSTGDWYVWDSARGIVSGNDPYFLLNSTAAEVTNTDYVDTYSAGFEISSTAPAAINANGGTFIFLAIA